jgi:hypothetical protein
MCKCLEREVLAGLVLWLDGSGAPSVPTRDDPPYTYDGDQYNDYISHVAFSFVVSLYFAIAEEAISAARSPLAHRIARFEAEKRCVLLGLRG